MRFPFARQLSVLAAAIFLQLASGTSAFAACDAGNSSQLGNFRGTTSDFNENTKNNEPKLAAKSGLGRSADEISFVHKIEDPSWQCKTGTKNGATITVQATKFKDGKKDEPIGGYWKSSAKICFVVVKASTKFAIYEYEGDGAYSGSWTSEKITNNENKPHAVSHIQFYKCEPKDKPLTGKLILKKKIEIEGGGEVDLPETVFTLKADGAETKSATVSFQGKVSDGEVKQASGPPFVLRTGKYIISETDLPHAPTGRKWVKAGVFCEIEKAGRDKPQSVIHEQEGEITLGAEETISCIVKNKLVKEKKGKLRIKKKTIGGFGKFTFTLEQGPDAVAPFDLETTSAGQLSEERTLRNLPSGTYVFSETAKSGTWALKEVSCSGLGVSAQVIEGKGEIVLQSNADATCTFKNELIKETERASITIKKIVKGSSKVEEFHFETTGEGLRPFSLVPPNLTEEVFANLKPGEYSIKEKIGNEWSGEVSCVGGEVDIEGLKAKIRIVGSENVICTYTNTRRSGKLVVSKRTIGGNDEFDFVVTGKDGFEKTFKLSGGGEREFPELPTGRYTISEVGLKNGWILKGVSCGQEKNGSVTIEIKDGQTTTCTFTNFKEKDDRMEDVTKAFIHRRVDNLLTHGPDRARLLRRLEEQPQPGSLKDYEPLKLVGGMLAGLVGSHVTDEPDIGPAGTGMIKNGPFGDEYESHSSLTRSRVGRFGSAAFSQLGRSSGSSDFSLPAFKFSASLSELRMAMQAIEAKKEEEKARLMGELGLGGQPYMRPMIGVRPERLDIWIEGQMSRYDDSTGGIRREGDFKILYVGADYAVTPGILIGTLVQFDVTNEDVKDPDLTGSVDGRGWMAGPYIGIKLTDHLIFDARAAWGTSDNDIKLHDGAAGWRNGSFDTTRWLATASLTGNWYYGAWRLTPQVSVAYGHEEYDSYKNNLGQIVHGAGVTIGRATFGTEVAYRFTTDDGTLIEPHLGITGIWNFDSDDLVINGVVVETNASRAKLDAGILIRRPDGLGLRAAVSYDGIGESDFEAWSGQVWLNLPMN